MQCVNCGFENIPGLTTCARCQSTLDWGNVDYHPPRRKDSNLRQRFIRRMASWRRRPRRFRRERHINHSVTVAITIRDWLCLLLPGLPQMRTPYKRRGKALLGLWLAMLLLGLWCGGWSSSGAFIGLAIAVHTFSIALALARAMAMRRLIIRIICGLMTTILLYVLLYRPAGWLCDQIAVPVGIQGIIDNEQMRNGDTVWATSTWTTSGTFARGDLVLYRMHAMGNHGWMLREGYGLDRIVGLPGDTVVVADGRIWVNGVESLPGQRPLLAVTRIGNYSLNLGPDQYAIVPSQLALYTHGEAAMIRDALARSTSVPKGNIIGKVFLRSRPLDRWAILR